jgi:molecular chaperone GrpE
MSRRRSPDDENEGMEGLADDAAGGALAPNPELEQALREAEASYDAQHPQQGGGRAPISAAQAAELEATRTQLAETQDRLLRLQADFDNFRKRTLREREEAHQFGHQNLVKDLLSAVDNLERAVEHARKSGPGDFEGLLQGIELVQREIAQVFGKHGVTEIEAQGVPFDPAVHEALAQLPDTSVPPGTVVQVFQKGYRLRDRMLRPAQVVVSHPGEVGAGSTPERGGS